MDTWKEMEGFIVKLERKEVHSCEKCTKAFTDEDGLRLHYERHDLEAQLYQKKLKEHMLSSRVVLKLVPIYRCNKCTRGFLNYLHLNDHQKEHSKSINKQITASESNKNELLKPHRCEECGVRFVGSSTLATHARLHLPYPHPCHCGVGFYEKNDLAIHNKIVHSIIKTETEHNGQNNPIKKKAKISVPKTLPQKYTKTEKNAKTIGKKTTLSRVKKIVPPKETKSKNNVKKVCVDKELQQTSKNKKEGFDNTDAYYKRNVDGKYSCSVCKETYMKQNEFKAHRAIHSNLKVKATHVCYKCGSSFDMKAQLIAHDKTHIDRQQGERIIWNCDTCGAVLKNNHFFWKHMLLHTGEKPFACHLCPKTFVQAVALARHLNVHNNVYVCKCEYCNKQFREKGARDLHLRTHTGYKPYTCRHCSKKFSDPSAFNRHKRIHTGEKPYACPYCPKAFSDNSAYIVHKRRHEGMTFICPHCKARHTSHAGLWHHIKTLHLKVGAVECAHCERRFTSKHNLISHLTRVHEKNKRHKCSHCSERFYDRYKLARHEIQTHPTIDDVRCEMCGMMFKTDIDKNKHIERVHDKPKSMCGHCNYECPCKSVLLKHIVWHHLGIDCKKCKKKFSTSAALRQHRCITCLICARNFRLESHLKKHLSDHEKGGRTCLPLKKNSKIKIPRFTCDHCKQNFNTKISLKSHIWTAHLVCMYCNVCMKRFYSESEFRLHKKLVCAKIKCEFCNERFPNSDSLKMHGEKCHKTENTTDTDVFVNNTQLWKMMS